MPYQYKREPLTPDEANRLASACETHQERLIVWTLLDTGLRVSELAGLTREHIDWQNHRLMIYGKGGIYGTKSKRRITNPAMTSGLFRAFGESSDLSLYRLWITMVP